MSSSIIGENSTGKEFDVTINNYPHIDLLRDKQVSYYRTLNNNQQKKFDAIFQEEKDKFEKKKKELSDEVSKLEVDIKNTIDKEELKRLELKKAFAKKELQSQLDFAKEKEQLIKENKQEEEKITNKLTAQCNQKVKDKSDELEQQAYKLQQKAKEKLDSKMSDMNSWKKLAEERRIEKEACEKECKANREKYIKDHNKKTNDMKQRLQNEYNVKESNLQNNWKTKYNNDINNWKSAYHNKPCNPRTVNYCSLATAQTVVNNHNAQVAAAARRRSSRRRRRRRRRWSDLHFKYDIKQMGFSPSGIPIVTFKYNDLVPDLTPHVTYQGVLAQQLLPLGLFDHEDEVVVLEDNGFYSVDYDMIDVEFKLV